LTERLAIYIVLGTLGPTPAISSEVVVSRSLNKVQLIGNLGADPEVRSTNNGSRVATLSVATSRQWNSAGGEKQEKTEWHRVICWNGKGPGMGLADVAEKYLKKGDKVYVEGRIEYRTWEDREKQTRYVTEIIARELIMLGSRGGPAPVGAGAAKGGAVAEGGGKTPESLDAFPEALDEEDDDLPF
jgi:single-strand DNA-binding protein